MFRSGGGEDASVAPHDQSASAARTNIDSENVGLHKFQARSAPRRFALRNVPEGDSNTTPIDSLHEEVMLAASVFPVYWIRYAALTGPD